ncbi:Hsp20/alpha crystallin family protein [Chitinophaga sp. OAE865]|uniref:Hsp20/alpha crystallin family protein n=1 Tax=Chitinophaga sp. OAE865 TaxID=2817898 RepID=UPI001AE7B959
MSGIQKRRATFPSLFSLFDDPISREFFNWDNSNGSSSGTTIPAVNIKETADNFEVQMAAPGMEKSDFKIQLDGNTLTITCDKESSMESNENEKFTRREFSYQAFQRTLLLPKDVVDQEGVTAKYDAGLLQLTIPKREEAKKKPPRLINIG